MKDILNKRISLALPCSCLVGIASFLMMITACHRDDVHFDRWNAYESQPYGNPDIQIVDSLEVTQGILDELKEFNNTPMIIRSQEDLKSIISSGKYKVETLFEHPLSGNDIPTDFSNDTCIILYYSLLTKVPAEIVIDMTKNEYKPEYLLSVHYNGFTHTSELMANQKCLIRTATQARIPKGSKVWCMEWFPFTQSQ